MIAQCCLQKCLCKIKLVNFLHEIKLRENEYSYQDKKPRIRVPVGDFAALLLLWLRQDFMNREIVKRINFPGKGLEYPITI